MSAIATDKGTFLGEHPRDGRQWDCQCGRCGSSLEFGECEFCAGDGYLDDDEEGEVICEKCRGNGAFPLCMSGWEWCEENPLPGRENVAPSTPEWFVVEEKP